MFARADFKLPLSQRERRKKECSAIQTLVFPRESHAITQWSSHP